MTFQWRKRLLYNTRVALQIFSTIGEDIREPMYRDTLLLINIRETYRCFSFYPVLDSQRYIFPFSFVRVLDGYRHRTKIALDRVGKRLLLQSIPNNFEPFTYSIIFVFLRLGIGVPEDIE